LGQSRAHRDVRIDSRPVGEAAIRALLEDAFHGRRPQKLVPTQHARQEFILLSNISRSFDAGRPREQPRRNGVDSTVLGPFAAGLQRELEHGEYDPAARGGWAPLLVEGTVAWWNGTPIPNSLVEVQQTAPNRLYEVQDDAQPEGRLCASFRTDKPAISTSSQSCPSAVPFPSTELPDNCSGWWGGIRSGPHTFISQ
jgi:hypothetical protein